MSVKTLRNRIPEHPCDEGAVRFNEPFVLRARTGGGVFWALSADCAAKGSKLIDRDYDLPKSSVEGHIHTDQRKMRRGLIMRECEHLNDLRRRFPGAKQLASIGNGNLLANIGFVAWSEGVLFCLQPEPVFQKRYTAVVSWKDGSVTIDEVWFLMEDHTVAVERRRDDGAEDITERVRFVTTGQPIIRSGFPVPLDHIAELFYDKRHLVNPIRFTLNGDTLFLPNAQLQEGLTRKALDGPVRVALDAQIDQKTTLPLSFRRWAELAENSPSSLDRAASFLKDPGVMSEMETLRDPAILLRVAGYIEALFARSLGVSGYDVIDGMRPLNEGEARFVNGHIDVYFRKAVYPHNIFVRWSDGSSGAVIYPGKSGRSGTSLPAAQEFMLNRLQVTDAVLLDNGGDVRLNYRGQPLVPSSEHRPEIRAMLAVMALPGSQGGHVTVS